jgi:hypothetical protein
MDDAFFGQQSYSWDLWKRRIDERKDRSLLPARQN